MCVCVFLSVFCILFAVFGHLWTTDKLERGLVQECVWFIWHFQFSFRCIGLCFLGGGWLYLSVLLPLKT